MEKTKFKKNIRTFSYAFLLVVGISLFSFATVNAASLYLSPSSGLYNVGQTFAVGVYVASSDQSMNAASGSLSFPQDKLEVTSISKAGSVMSLWIQEPSFSNNTGIATFEGIVLNPGFTGSDGKIITINFKAKSSGTAPITFASSSVLANDGAGTNILNNIGSASFILGVTEPSVPKPTIPVSELGTLKAPDIVSLTHPDSDVWYSNSDVAFSWQVPDRVTETRLLVNGNSNSIPTVSYIPAISNKELSDIGDGIWYFHARLRNSQGLGESAHFKFQIDTEKPDSLDVSIGDREDPTTPTVKLLIDGSDATSGIDYYEITVNGGEAKQWRDDGTNIYETEILAPGDYVIDVKAIDKASNFLMTSVEVVVEAMDAPVITEYSKIIESGEKFVVKGTTYANMQVTLYVEGIKSEYLSQTELSDKDGNFVVEYDERLEAGAYSAYVKVRDERGAQSEPSEKVTMTAQGFSLQDISFEMIVLIILAIILIIGFIYLDWLKRYVFIRFKKPSYKETGKAQDSIEKAIGLFKNETRSQLKLLSGKAKTKKKFTKREERILERLRQDLDDTEKFVKEEITNIKREIDRIHPKKKKRLK